MDQLINILKALSDPSRLRAYMALMDGELCVCQLIELLGLAPSTVSKHMSILKQAGLVKSRKDGRWVQYQMPHVAKGSNTSRVNQLISDALHDDATVLHDKTRLKKIKKEDLDALCKRQKCT